MRKFLGISFMGHPKVAAIVNFGICCLAVLSLLLVAFRAEATPQKASDKPALSSLKSGNKSRSLAGPSPSCFSRSACIADKNFKQEFNNFVNFINTTYPSAPVPSAIQLQAYSCSTLSAGGTNSTDTLAKDVDIGQWLVTFLSYSYWSTQAGTNPYPTAPVWWCFLDNASRYVITDTEEIDGASNIIASFDGLGKPAADGGQGFYVAQATVTDAYPAVALGQLGSFAAQTFVNKELVAIDIAAPGTTKPLSPYLLLMKIKTNQTYPLKTISLMQETVNKLATIEWLGLCAFACKNCTPGTVCPPSVS